MFITLLSALTLRVHAGSTPCCAHASSMFQHVAQPQRCFTSPTRSRAVSSTDTTATLSLSTCSLRYALRCCARRQAHHVGCAYVSEFYLPRSKFNFSLNSLSYRCFAKQRFAHDDSVIRIAATLLTRTLARARARCATRFNYSLSAS